MNLKINPQNSLTLARFMLKYPVLVIKWSLSMKTYLAKKNEVEQKWLLVDAADQILGRLASDIAVILMGKNKPQYTPNVDVGDLVVVVKAEKIRTSGKKAQTKEYDY